MLKRGARFLYVPRSSPSWLLTRRYRKPSARESFRQSPSSHYGQAQPVSSTAGAVRDSCAAARSADPAERPIAIRGGGPRRCMTTPSRSVSLDRAPQARRPALAAPSRSAPSAGANHPLQELSCGAVSLDAGSPSARGFASCLRGDIRDHSPPPEKPRGARAIPRMPFPRSQRH